MQRFIDTWSFLVLVRFVLTRAALFSMLRGRCDYWTLSDLDTFSPGLEDFAEENLDGE